MLAIIIPYYKLTFFESTLESLANQTDQRFKVYIGDDASPENCGSLLGKYKEKFDFIYHRFEDNLGGTSLTQQWERCIALSGDEEWLMILGDDDVLGKNVVEEFYKQYFNFSINCNVVRCATMILNEKSAMVSDVYTHPRLEKGFDFFIRKLKWETRSSLSEYFFSREMFLKYKFREYPFSFYSDDKAWVEFSEDKLIYAINESIIYIRISPLSLSGSVDKSYVNEAEFQYVNPYYETKLFFFSKENRFILLKKIEYYYAAHETSFKCWLILYLRYWENFDIRELFRFHRRLLNRRLRID